MISGVCQVRRAFQVTLETLELPVTPEAQVMQAVQVTRVPAQVPELAATRVPSVTLEQMATQVTLGQQVTLGLARRTVTQAVQDLQVMQVQMVMLDLTEPRVTQDLELRVVMPEVQHLTLGLDRQELLVTLVPRAVQVTRVPARVQASLDQHRLLHGLVKTQTQAILGTQVHLVMQGLLELQVMQAPILLRLGQVSMEPMV